MTRLKRPPGVEDAGTMFAIAANYGVGEFRLAMRTVASRVAIRLEAKGLSARASPASSNPRVQVVRKIAGWVPSSKLRMLIAATAVRAPLILRKRRKSANN